MKKNVKELATATAVAAAVLTTGAAVNATAAHADDAITGAPASTASATVQTPTVKAENTASTAVSSLADATQQANNAKQAFDATQYLAPSSS